MTNHLESGFHKGNYFTFDEFTESPTFNYLKLKWNVEPSHKCKDKNCAPPRSTGIKNDETFHIREFDESCYKNTDTGF